MESAAVDFLPSYNLAPTAREPIVRLNEDGRRVLTLAVWDYGKATLRKRPPFFNARSETFVTGEAFAHRRCLVPVNGFYEWAMVNGRKQAFVFVREDREVFSMGGCWQTWHGPGSATELTYVELTTEPTPLVAEIHKRMPLIINRAEEAVYLEGSLAEAQELARPNPMEGFIRFAVGPAVNSTRKDAPELIAPAEKVEVERTLFSLGG